MSHLQGREWGDYISAIGVRMKKGIEQFKDYVLCVPYDTEDSADFLGLNVAPFRFVRANTTIPVPKIVAYDTTKENPLRRRFLLMERPLGVPAFQEYESRSFKYRMGLARELGNVFKQMLGMRSHEPGYATQFPTFSEKYNSFTESSGGTESRQVWAVSEIKPLCGCEGCIDTDVEGEVDTDEIVQQPGHMTEISRERWHKRYLPGAVPLAGHDRAAWGRKVQRFILELLEMQLFVDFRYGNALRCAFLKAYKDMVWEMFASGLFDGMPFVLCHRGMGPQNIFIRSEYEDGKGVGGLDAPFSILTGIVGWEKAYFGPAFLACEPPTWLWSRGEDENEVDLKNSPSRDENMRIKQAFDHAAGAEYCNWAYGEPYQFMRDLVSHVMFSTPPDNVQNVKAAADLLRRWDCMMGGSGGPPSGSERDGPDSLIGYIRDQVDKMLDNEEFRLYHENELMALLEVLGS